MIKQALFDQLPEQLDAGSIRQAPSKKRSAPTGRPSSGSSHNVPIPASMSSLGTADFTRASQVSTSTYPTTMSQGTMDMQGGGVTAFQDNSFAANFGDFMTPDMQRSTPESTASTATSAQRMSYGGQQMGMHNPVNKLDSLMFPSEDPFAYPNQPMMELGFPGKTDPSTSVGDQNQDMQLFLTGTFDDVESQIFGQPPPYMMHQQGQGMMGVSPQPMYANPVNLMTMQPNQSQPMMQQRRPVSQTHAVHQGHSMAHRRAHRQQHQERQIQQMFTEQGMQADWGGFFGSGRGGFQGM
jgi:hypothetical protein